MSASHEAALIERAATHPLFQAACQRYACENGSSHAIAAAALRATAAPDLLAELQHAHQIILNALNVMTPGQKLVWQELNEAKGCDGEGTTRANERMAVIAKAVGGQP